MGTSEIADAFADRLGRYLPMVYRVAGPTWRFVMRALGKPRYWESRRNYAYYREVIRLAKVYAPDGRQVIDVGANVTLVVHQLDWFARRVTLDVRYRPPQAGVETQVVDFMDYQPDAKFDLVLCLQVLEQLQEPAAFTQKLFAIGRTVIISVPYKWPQGLVKTHWQDPVDERKLESWTQRQPVETSIISDEGKERLLRFISKWDRQKTQRPLATQHLFKHARTLETTRGYRRSIGKSNKSVKQVLAKQTYIE